MLTLKNLFQEYIASNPVGRDPDTTIIYNQSRVMMVILFFFFRNTYSQTLLEEIQTRLSIESNKVVSRLILLASSVSGTRTTGAYV